MSLNDSTEEEFKCGWLKKRTTGVGGGRWRDRYFVFTAKFHLLWFKDPKEWATIKRKGKSKKELMVLDHTSVVRDSKFSPSITDAPNPFCFQVAEKDGRVLSLCATDGEKDAVEWIDLLQEALSLGLPEYTPAKYRIVRSLKNNQFRIPPGDLTFEGDEIGSGASGVVKRGVWLKTTEVAIKILKDLPEFLDANESIAFYREMETLSKLRHGSIVQMYGFCRKDNFMCLVTEFVRGGNLSALIHRGGTGPLDDWYQIELAMNISRGMVYLHSQDVIHRDLKPANILIESLEEGKLKVCDFGISTVVTKGHITPCSEAETSLGSPQYAAPELAQDNHTSKVDIFSFAIILWEIAMRAQPWPEFRFGSQIASKYAAGERPEIPSGNFWKKLIERCWDHNPDNRPTYKEAFADIEVLKQEYKRPVPHKLPSNIRDLTDLTPRPPEKVDKLAFKIGSIFGASRQSVPWQEFATAFGNALAIIPSDVKQLQHVFDTEGVVTKQTWDTFLLWFSPLKAISSYQTEQDDGYDVSVILSICTAPYFRAFLGATEAQTLLKDQDSGTFLIRFSTTNPGHYALSATYGPNVGHWRITCERKPFCQPVFKVDVREYSSLEELVHIHSPGGETMKTKTGENCFLIYPLQKPDNFAGQ